MKRQTACSLTTAITILLVAGCTQQPTRSSVESAGSASPVTDIRYQVGPCHGTCPVYSVDIGADGTTRFSGEQFTAVDGERVRANDPERFALVRRQLSSWQPAMGTTIDTPDCGPRATDLSHYTVTWTSREGQQAVLNHDSGCRAEDARQLTDSLRSLPQALGIDSWVGH
ncbi:DUF6438 domain-containing protein [Salinicola socius]|uniref:DUF6438 domain-containing protein n=1 Tax=Salinicola socius TaxID=404433 RepID=A0A1Q8SWN6_9GAMM|nr:DUF6438 domain-containing protein [Salinicola socius]OLO05878.1 hypothetical protein BTW07_02795 [Salinicola socius]